MFREIRRKRKRLSEEETSVIMESCTSGVLACLGDEGYPYAVPLSYVYFNNKIYFHSAKAGHKIDAVTSYPKVSFAVIGEDTVVGEEYTAHYRSAVAFGTARIVKGEERKEAFAALVKKYSGNQPEEERRKAIEECKKAHIIAVDVEHITGKASPFRGKSKSGGSPAHS